MIQPTVSRFLGQMTLKQTISTQAGLLKPRFEEGSFLIRMKYR